MTARATGLALLLVLICACTPSPEGRAAAGTEPRPDTESPIPAASSVPTAPTVPAVPTAPRPPADGDAAVPDGDAAVGKPFRRSTFDADAVREASGIAVSRTVPGRAYLVDDGRGVFLLDLDSGATKALSVSVPTGQRSLRMRDLEDVAVGPCGPGDARSCVYVGDIGDNRRRRDVVEVWRFQEPPGPAPAGPAPAAAVVDAIRLTYPGGPQDAEALIVDDAGTPLIISKARYDESAQSTGETRVYRAPGFADGELADLGAMDVPEPAVGILSGFVGNVVTGADRLGDRVLLRTYDSVLLLQPPQAGAGTPSPAGVGADLTGLAGWEARELSPSPLPQAEAIAFLPDGQAYVTVSEHVSGVWQAALPAHR